jgi:hypothetical protein
VFRIGQRLPFLPALLGFRLQAAERIERGHLVGWILRDPPRLFLVRFLNPIELAPRRTPQMVPHITCAIGALNPHPDPQRAQGYRPTTRLAF